MRIHLAALLLISVAGCGPDNAVTCTDDTRCLRAGIHGMCLQSPAGVSKFCAFGDTLCASGERWDPTAGDGLAGMCVGAGLDMSAAVDMPDLSSGIDLAPSCSDGIKDGTETDVDCGGSCPTKCALAKGCKTANDCASNICNAGVNQCVATACMNGVKDPNETDVDCGGACATKCAVGQMCIMPADCQTKTCTAGLCAAAPSCTDGMKDGDETDVDCGGSCPACATGKMCGGDKDCSSRNCATTCQPCGHNMVTVPNVGGGTMCIDAYEVTAAQYAIFLNAGPSTSGQPAVCSFNTSYFPAASGYNCTATSYDPINTPTHPVVCVNWCDAFAYCKSVGKRLCGDVAGGPCPFASFTDATHSEWFNACSAGGVKAYPYGGVFNGAICNTGTNVGYVTDVGKFSGCVGGYAGLYDMSGNAAEWEDSCDASTGGNDNCRIRGGDYQSRQGVGASCDNSGGAPTQSRQYWGDGIGFRCCGL